MSSKSAGPFAPINALVQPLQTIWFNEIGGVDANPKVVVAYGEWRTCIAAKGYSVSSEGAFFDLADQEIGRYIPKQMAEAKATEMTLANAYADCIGPVSTVRDGIRLRLRTQFLDQHALQIRQLTTTIERVVSRLSAEYGVTPGS